MRHYEVEGKQLPSVTTILGKMLAKEALVPWAAKCTAESIESQMMDYYFPERCMFEIPDTKLPVLLKTAKGAYRKKSSEAMDKGTRVHEAIEAWIHSDGRLEATELTDEVARQGLKQFLSWGEQHDINILSYEQQVSDGESYAGRYDLLAMVNGRKTLIDFKTSTGIWDEYIVQVHAYAACIDGVEQVAVLRLDKETGEIEYKEWPYQRGYVEAFRCMAAAYNFLFPYKEPKRKGKKGEVVDGN